MTAGLIQQVGEALYGPRYQSEMARDLEVTDRTVRRWIAGTADPPGGVYADLLRLVAERAAVLAALVAPLKRAGKLPAS